MHRLAALLAVALCACGNPDNQVYGGIIGGGDVPNAFIYNVGSAIHGVANVTTQGGVVPMDVIVLTDRVDLCKKLGPRPDYFSTPSEAFVALAMTTVKDRAGTFRIGTDGGVVLMVTAGPGTQVFLYGSAGGQISVRQFENRQGGEADGSFDMYMVDFQQTLNRMFGKFKTAGCDALQNVTF